MIPTPIVAAIIGSWALHRCFLQRAGRRNYWSVAAALAVGVAISRIVFVSLWMYLLGRPSSWLQVPAIIMAYCGLPEVLLMQRRMENSIEYLTQLGARF